MKLFSKLPLVLVALAVGTAPIALHAAKLARPARVKEAVQRVPKQERPQVKEAIREVRVKVRTDIQAIRKDETLTRPQKKEQARTQIKEARAELKTRIQGLKR